MTQRTPVHNLQVANELYEFVNQEVLQGYRMFFTELLPQASQYVNVPVMAVEVAVIGVLALGAQMLEIYFAIVVGGQIAKKHRILAAIGMYLLINMGVGMSAIVSEKDAPKALEILRANDVDAYVMGYIVRSDEGVILC